MGINTKEEKPEGYEEALERIYKQFLKDKYSLCLEVRYNGRVLHQFPEVPCPAMILEMLELGRF